MSSNTTNLNLLKKDPSTDGSDYFNIETMFNENWDKIDTADGNNIKKSLATAANDFLVASGVGVFVKKTLAEVKTILGLGSAAYTASTDYATSAQGATAEDTAADLVAHLADIEYQTPTIVGTQIQLERKSDTKRLYFYLGADLTGGAITISLDVGATSLPLKDIDNVALTSLDKGYQEVIDNTTFFTLRPRGAKLDGIISAIEAWGGVVASPQKIDNIVASIQAVAGWDSDLVAGNIKKNATILGVTGNHFATLVAGSTLLIASVDATAYGGTYMWTKARELTVNFDGIIRVSFGVWSNNQSAALGQGRIYVNGAPQGTIRTNTLTTGEWMYFQEDIAVNAGDKVQIYTYTGDVSYQAATQNFRLYTGSIFAT